MNVLQIWIGSEENKTESVRHCINTVKNWCSNKGHKYILYGQEECTLLLNKFGLELDIRLHPVTISDVVRFLFLYTEGGVYFDADMEVQDENMWEEELNRMDEDIWYLGENAWYGLCISPMICKESGHPVLHKVVENIVNDYPKSVLSGSIVYETIIIDYLNSLQEYEKSSIQGIPAPILVARDETGGAICHKHAWTWGGKNKDHEKNKQYYER